MASLEGPLGGGLLQFPDQGQQGVGGRIGRCHQRCRDDAWPGVAAARHHFLAVIGQAPSGRAQEPRAGRRLANINSTLDRERWKVIFRPQVVRQHDNRIRDVALDRLVVQRVLGADGAPRVSAGSGDQHREATGAQCLDTGHSPGDAPPEAVAMSGGELHDGFGCRRRAWAGGR